MNTQPRINLVTVGNHLIIFDEENREETEKKVIRLMEQGGEERKNADGTTTRREFEQVMVKENGTMNYIWDKTGNKVKTIIWEEVWKDGKRLSKTEIRTTFKKF